MYKYHTRDEPTHGVDGPGEVSVCVCVKAGRGKRGLRRTGVAKICVACILNMVSTKREASVRRSAFGESAKSDRTKVEREQNREAQSRNHMGHQSRPRDLKTLYYQQTGALCTIS